MAGSASSLASDSSLRYRQNSGGDIERSSPGPSSRPYLLDLADGVFAEGAESAATTVWANIALCKKGNVRSPSLYNC